jgi:death-on-curing protein
VAVPRATAGGTFAHEDVFAMAAAYAFHIAQNQPFVDGNKRRGCSRPSSSLISTVTIRDPEGRLYDAMIAIAERRMDKVGLATLLRELSGTPSSM